MKFSFSTHEKIMFFSNRVFLNEGKQKSISMYQGCQSPNTKFYSEPAGPFI